MHTEGHAAEGGHIMQGVKHQGVSSGNAPSIGIKTLVPSFSPVGYSTSCSTCKGSCQLHYSIRRVIFWRMRNKLPCSRQQTFKHNLSHHLGRGSQFMYSNVLEYHNSCTPPDFMADCSKSLSRRLVLSYAEDLVWWVELLRIKTMCLKKSPSPSLPSYYYSWVLCSLTTQN